MRSRGRRRTSSSAGGASRSAGTGTRMLRHGPAAPDCTAHLLRQRRSTLRETGWGKTSALPPRPAGTRMRACTPSDVNPVERHFSGACRSTTPVGSSSGCCGSTKPGSNGVPQASRDVRIGSPEGPGPWKRNRGARARDLDVLEKHIRLTRVDPDRRSRGLVDLHGFHLQPGRPFIDKHEEPIMLTVDLGHDDS